MKKYYMFIVVACVLFSMVSCKTNNNKTVKAEETIMVPNFNADSAYQYVQAQVDFGPRVPNTPQHVACGEYLAKKLEEHGARVINQYADLIAYDGAILKARNIIGSYKPESKKRILLFAHWDSRPWADEDLDPKKHYTPILGANDGASGVGVLLEIARLINQQAPALGIDVIFFDAEDYGAHDSYTGNHKAEYWALGTQYWTRNLHVQGYNARFGILLDMVGGKHATFFREGYSEKYAKNVNKKVWRKAKELGYSNVFIDEETGAVTDDHYFVNINTQIPCIDIVPYIEGSRHGFGDFWHTVNDTMDVIDKSTLKAVGQTVLEVIYNEK